jgi:uncharacterized protein with GYD domain
MLFCITGQYTPKALEGMAKSPNTSRRVELEKLLTAAGAKLVGMYATMADGPGAMSIFDADPANAAAVGAVIASSDGVKNFKMVPLFTMEEVIGIKQKRIQLQSSFMPPGQ